jgi:phage shock protein A
MIEQILFWAGTGLVVLLLTVVGFFLSTLVAEIKDFKSSLIGQIGGVQIEMNELNKKLAEVITNQDWHKKELERLDSRMGKIEDKNT